MLNENKIWINFVNYFVFIRLCVRFRWFEIYVVNLFNIEWIRWEFLDFFRLNIIKLIIIKLYLFSNNLFKVDVKNLIVFWSFEIGIWFGY